MGRSQMQGTPWHYEYLNNKSSGKNSINCIYNNGTICICKFSMYKNKKCVGKNNCEDFERCSFHRPELYQKSKMQIEKAKMMPQGNSKTSKKIDRRKMVECGDVIWVQSKETQEKIEIHVSDKNNPFYEKQLNDVISIKNVKYSIVKISKRNKR